MTYGGWNWIRKWCGGLFYRVQTFSERWKMHISCQNKTMLAAKIQFLSCKMSPKKWRWQCAASRLISDLDWYWVFDWGCRSPQGRNCGEKEGEIDLTPCKILKSCRLWSLSVLVDWSDLLHYIPPSFLFLDSTSRVILKIWKVGFF